MILSEIILVLVGFFFVSLQSYCLKVKELDDEEYSYAALQEPLYRVETGNYEYRYKFIIIPLHKFCDGVL